MNIFRKWPEVNNRLSTSTFWRDARVWREISLGKWDLIGRFQLDRL